jgi:NAD(P)-dependent dehydrogenase (short-subunit alcohol dehydrogenase family)
MSPGGGQGAGGLRLDGRVAAVTGAGRGIGRAYALLLGHLGARVVVNDLGGSTLGRGADAGPADDVVQQIRAAGGVAAANYADVSAVDGGASVIETAVAEFGGIDIVVNNAGNMVWGSLPEAGIETIEAHWAVHVRGSFNTLHAAWPHFLAKDYGRVVLTTSAGMFGLPGNLGYATAKSSMIGLAKALTAGRGKANITVNCIAPNAVTRLGARTPAEQAAQEAMAPAMDPALVAPMVAYLAHESCGVSGEVYVAGAGRFARLFVGVTPGYVHPGDAGVTVDDVAANWAAINDEAGYYVPGTLMDWAGHYLAHLGTRPRGEGGPDRGHR